MRSDCSDLTTGNGNRVAANAKLGRPVTIKVVEGEGHGVGWGDWDAVIAFNDDHPTPPVLLMENAFRLRGRVHS